MGTQQPRGKRATRRIAIEIPKDLEAAYSNGALITHTQSEMVIDFVQILPRMPKGKAVARVIISPIHAKRLQQVLAQTITNFENQFGEVKLPPTLVDELFRSAPGSDGEEEDEGE